MQMGKRTPGDMSDKANSQPSRYKLNTAQQCWLPAAGAHGKTGKPNGILPPHYYNCSIQQTMGVVGPEGCIEREKKQWSDGEIVRKGWLLDKGKGERLFLPTARTTAAAVSNCTASWTWSPRLCNFWIHCRIFFCPFIAISGFHRCRIRISDWNC